MTDTQELHVVLGTGPAGLALVTELAARGHRVRSVNRRGGAPLPDGVEAVLADLADPHEAATALAGATVAYHCVNVAYHLQVDLLPGIGAAILAAAERHDTRLVVLDTLYPYGPADGEHITEATPWAATSRKGRLRARLDAEYLEAHRAGRVRTVMGRSADFYGPGVLNSTLGAATFAPALEGEPVLAFGDIDLPHAFTYIRDVARGLATLGSSPRGDGRVWHLPTVPARSVRAVLALVEATAGRPVTVEVLPEARPFGPFDATLMAEYAEMFYQHTTPQNLVSAAFEAEFGVSPTPLEDGIAATADWYRALVPTG